MKWQTFIHNKKTRDEYRVIACSALHTLFNDNNTFKRNPITIMKYVFEGGSSDCVKNIHIYFIGITLEDFLIVCVPQKFKEPPLFLLKCLRIFP